jgi:hypothetical protein
VSCLTIIGFFHGLILIAVGVIMVVIGRPQVVIVKNDRS